VNSLTIVPCPTCWLPAEVVTVPFDALSHSRCIDGHDNALVPAVLRHLLTISEQAKSAQPACRPGRCV
jgi:hypothetical protein